MMVVFAGDGGFAGIPGQCVQIIESQVISEKTKKVSIFNSFLLIFGVAVPL